MTTGTAGEGGFGRERSLQVLLVDDERDFLHLLAFEFCNVGFQVTAVDTGRAAVEAAQRQKFDVAITDLKMPDMDGIEIMVTLKQIDPSLPVIMATGYLSEATRISVGEYGAYGYILKPFSFEDILSLVDRAVGEAGQPGQRGARA
jgi:DNA-binding NtrC family response regulator